MDRCRGAALTDASGQGAQLRLSRLNHAWYDIDFVGPVNDSVRTREAAFIAESMLSPEFTVERGR